jgi:hypothetical protein
MINLDGPALCALISSTVTTINTSSVSAAVPLDGFAAAMASLASTCRAEASKYVVTRGGTRVWGRGGGRDVAQLTATWLRLYTDWNP